MSYLQVKNLYKKYGEHTALKDINFDIERGEFVVFVGPSGCGKSTLLRTIAGLESSSEGGIHIEQQDITELHPSKRDVAMVFQSYALYPHMTVERNMSFALKLAGRPEQEIKDKVGRVAKALKLEEYLDRKPKALSGGQRQRVAIGRAIVRNPKVFLFDEPLSNLDAALRVEMRIELSRLHHELGSTMIYVTHDQVEAMTLADKVVIMDVGEVAQIGSPLELYHQPANEFVATFIGTPKMNTLQIQEASGQSDTLRVSFPDSRPVELDAARYNGSAGDIRRIGFRPETLAFTTPEQGDVEGDVEVVEQLGSETLTYVRTLSGETLVVRAEPKLSPKLNQHVGVRLDRKQIYLFDALGRALNNYQTSDWKELVDG